MGVKGVVGAVLVQDEKDMNLIVTALKMKLAPFGWVEQVRRDQKTFTVSKVGSTTWHPAAPSGTSLPACLPACLLDEVIYCPFPSNTLIGRLSA